MTRLTVLMEGGIGLHRVIHRQHIPHYPGLDKNSHQICDVWPNFFRKHVHEVDQIPGGGREICRTSDLNSPYAGKTV